MIIPLSSLVSGKLLLMIVRSVTLGDLFLPNFPPQLAFHLHVRTSGQPLLFLPENSAQMVQEPCRREKKRRILEGVRMIEKKPRVNVALLRRSRQPANGTTAQYDCKQQSRSISYFTCSGSTYCCPRCSLEKHRLFLTSYQLEKRCAANCSPLHHARPLTSSDRLKFKAYRTRIRKPSKPASLESSPFISA